MSQEMNPEQIGMPSDTGSENSAVDPELIRQINTQAGANALKDLFATGSIKHDEHPIDHKMAALLLSNPILNKSKKSPLTSIANSKLEKNMGKFLESLGSKPFPKDEKSLDKLHINAMKLINQASGLKGVNKESAQYITNSILKAVANGNLQNLQPLLEEELTHVKNRKQLTDKVKGLFEGNLPEETASDEDHEKLNSYLDENKLNSEINSGMEPTEQFAEGGPVAQSVNPDQDMRLAASKARIVGHLTSLKPQPLSQTPILDNPYKDKTAEKTYRNASNIAIKPLSVLKKVQNGTIKAEDVKHLVTMYPEIHDLMTKKITEHLIPHQLNGTRPNSKIIQGLSLLTGTALRSDMTPSGIQAAQASFVQAQKQQQAESNPNKPKKKTSTLENFAKPYETKEQARDARANKD